MSVEIRRGRWPRGRQGGKSSGAAYKLRRRGSALDSGGKIGDNTCRRYCCEVAAGSRGATSGVTARPSAEGKKRSRQCLSSVLSPSSSLPSPSPPRLSLAPAAKSPAPPSDLGPLFGGEIKTPGFGWGFFIFSTVEVLASGCSTPVHFLGLHLRQLQFVGPLEGKKCATCPISAPRANAHGYRHRNRRVQQCIQQGGEPLPEIFRRGGRFALGCLFAHADLRQGTVRSL